MKNIYDLKSEEIEGLIALAQGINVKLYKSPFWVVAQEDVNEFNVKQHCSWSPLYNPEQFIPLLELYKPYITPLNDTVSVEIVGNTTSVKTERSPDYVAVKAKTIRHAVCLAIVAYHFGYEVDVDKLLVYEND